MAPINGNEVIRDIKRQRDSMPKGYGEITDPKTGRILASAFSEPDNNATQPGNGWGMQEVQQQIQPQKPSEAEMIYNNERIEAGDQEAIAANYGGGSPQGYINGEADMEYMSPEEVKATRTDYLNTMGKFSNFAEEKNIDMNEMFSQLSEEYTKEDIAMLKDSRKIENYNDAVKVGMMTDELADLFNIDTEKFFGPNGTVEECGSDCQERRDLMQHQADDYEGEHIMNQPDEEFPDKYAALLG